MTTMNIVNYPAWFSDNGLCAFCNHNTVMHNKSICLKCYNQSLSEYYQHKCLMPLGMGESNIKVLLEFMYDNMPMISELSYDWNYYMFRYYCMNLKDDNDDFDYIHLQINERPPS